jgi:PWWP domain
LTKCYSEQIFERDKLPIQNRFRCRLDRFFWKQAVPLHEANSRGVTQSSIWGNLAATIWARESSKKPFWPALCLGILPPAEQREGWHQAVTERNESRLPEKLRSQLIIAKKRCEQAQKRQSLSYFLVEFLGTHEFIWVRETDIIENFDPSSDPNKTYGKKSRSTSSVVGSKTYATAIQECVWASEEYENVLQDAFESAATGDNEDDDNNTFTFQNLAQSDDELDQGDEHGYQNDNDNMDMSDMEESNFLISHDGMFDPSMAARKGTKKRVQPQKKQTSKKDKESSPASSKDDPSKRKKSRPKANSDVVGTEGKDTASVSADGLNITNDVHDLERRRKKRLRDHENPKIESNVRTKGSDKRHRRASHELNLVNNKHDRATAIVKGYLIRLAKQSDIKSLALSGIMTMPSALVDSNGILGMALAFRAASGRLCMPDDGKEQLAKFKPWEAIDTERPKSSSERIRNLKKKIDLVETEINIVRTNTERRRQLELEYISKNTNREMAVEQNDASARLNHYKKRKKCTPSKSDIGNISDNESPIGKMPALNFQHASSGPDTSGGSEITPNYETHNGNDDSMQVDAVDDVEEIHADVDTDATAGYDSAETVEGEDCE